MSVRGFIRFLQQIITMTDPRDERSRQLAKMVFWDVIEMALRSHTVDMLTADMMDNANNNIDSILDHRDEFASVPGETENNRERRYRLEMSIRPHC